MSSYLPISLPITIATLICGMSRATFECRILAPGLVELDARDRVVTASLEAFLGREISDEEYEAAKHRRSIDYRHHQHVVGVQ